MCQVPESLYFSGEWGDMAVFLKIVSHIKSMEDIRNLIHDLYY